ncbi:MAG: DUF2971 domain-containing protein [Bacteroidota bacterium]
MTREENLNYRSRNIIGFDINSTIFRVFSSSDWLIDAIRNQSLTLVKPNTWDDPFENVVFRSTATMKDGRRVGFSKIERLFYGLCWTLNGAETDALWRIYSPRKEGVRVQVNASRLYDSFFNLDNEFAILSYFIGKVDYLSEAKIKEKFENPEILSAFVFDSTAQGNALTLLVKRTEFAHENEVRLIYRGNKERDDLRNPFYRFHIDPNDLFEEALFDPRMPDNRYSCYSDELKKLGFKNKISKSSLYSLPTLNLKLNV